MKIKTGVKYYDRDGFLFFKTITGEKGHIILHMVDSVLVNTETGELTVTNSHHEMPEIIVEEIYINLISDFFEITIDPITEDIIEISCKLVKNIGDYK